MHIFVMHSELRGRGGHAYMESLGWVRACRTRGVRLDLFASARAHPDVVAETGAVPMFHESWEDLARFVSRTDHDGPPDPYSGTLERFMRGSWVVAQGCRRAWSGARERPDAVIFPWSHAAVANGAAEWLADVPVGERPRVLFNVVRPEPGWRLDAEREEADGDFSFYRFAARRLRALAPPGGLTFTAVDPRLARLVSHVTQTACRPAPLHHPYPDVRDLERLRTGGARGGPRIGILGPSREEKGQALLASLIGRICAQRPEASVFLQVSSRERAEALSQDVQAGGRSARLDIQVGALAAEDYYARIAEADLILLPYLPEAYAMMPSGVFGEALAAGVPVVAPAGTWLSDRLDEGWGAGESFASASAEDIAAAAFRVLDRLPSLRARAASGAEAWRKAHSLEAYIDHAFGLLGLEARKP